jgi:antitoxin (DNA-binding transcriptional repressor) of toxin-antitoxin stability system
MKTISIEELHQQTGAYVRAAQQEPILIADGGQQMAVLKPLRGAEMAGKPFLVRDLASLPKVEVETSRYISEDRDAR